MRRPALRVFGFTFRRLRADPGLNRDLREDWVYPPRMRARRPRESCIVFCWYLRPRALGRRTEPATGKILIPHSSKRGRRPRPGLQGLRPPRAEQSLARSPHNGSTLSGESALEAQRREYSERREAARAALSGARRAEELGRRWSRRPRPRARPSAAFGYAAPCFFLVSR